MMCSVGLSCMRAESFAQADPPSSTDAPYRPHRLLVVGLATSRLAAGPHRRRLAVAGLALAVTLLLTTGLSVAVGALVVLGGLAGVGVALFWGLLRSRGMEPTAIIRVRSLFSIAWIAGPPLAAFVMGAYGPRSVLAVMAVVAACGLAIDAVGFHPSTLTCWRRRLAGSGRPHRIFKA